MGEEEIKVEEKGEGHTLSGIEEIEKRKSEAKRHMLLVQPGVMDAFYHGKAAAFEEVISVFKEKTNKMGTEEIEVWEKLERSRMDEME